MSSRFPRYVVIHGHFYQPPRENPWTEAIEKQDSAFPFHDWNERIARECYTPNGMARVVDSHQKVIDLVNNYSYMSFNFGPTLLSWYEIHHPREYEKILLADERSRKRFGFGNAIAQAYNHRILPLAPRREQVTQVRWGMADFRRRFGREPESLWLPETACNRATLEVLAEHGLKYVILAPSQAEKIRPYGSPVWIDVSQGIVDPRRAYRHFLSEDRKKYIDVFFYDGNLSRDIAFNKLMSSAKNAAERFGACFDHDSKEPQIVHAATDGESYGHHEHFADMTLAYLLKYELPHRGMTVTNYARYLDAHPPNWEVEIKEGPKGEGTAWSCSHGVGRWKEDCGCGAVHGHHQKWREPLKDTLDWLEKETGSLFQEQGSVLFKDPWQARDAYIDVILDRSDENVERFTAHHLKSPEIPDGKVKALKLLEMARNSQLMHTSCGWFFSEISGIEAVQNLKYASRAVQLAREITGRDFEEELLLKLSQAPSNRPDLGNGRSVYTQYVLPSVMTFDRILAHYATYLLFNRLPQKIHFYGYNIHRHFYTEKVTLTRKLTAGRVSVTSEVTKAREEKIFWAVYSPWPAFTLRIYVKPFETEDELKRIEEKAAAITDETPFQDLERAGSELFGDSYFTLRGLLHDEREEILNVLLKEKLGKLYQNYPVIFKEFFPVLKELRTLEKKLPQQIKSQFEFMLHEELVSGLTRFGQDGNLATLESLMGLVKQARESGLGASTPQSERVFELVILREFAVFSKEWTVFQLVRVSRLVEFAGIAGFHEWRYRMENQVFSALVSKVYPRLSEADGDEAGLLKAVIKLAEKLNINVELSYKVFQESKAEKLV